MKIVLTDAQTVLDDIVNADVLNRFGEVESFGLLKYEEVAEKIGQRFAAPGKSNDTIG